MNELFRRFASRTSAIVGSPWAFILAVVALVAWGLSGPIFGFSDTWQLVINTVTTVVTFLVVFLIQNTQNRDAKAIHLKLDELLRAVREARTSMIDLEDLPDETLDRLQKEFQKLRDDHTRTQEEVAEALEEVLTEDKEERSMAERFNGSSEKGL